MGSQESAVLILAWPAAGVRARIDSTLSSRCSTICQYGGNMAPLNWPCFRSEDLRMNRTRLDMMTRKSPMMSFISSMSIRLAASIHRWVVITLIIVLHWSFQGPPHLGKIGSVIVLATLARHWRTNVWFFLSPLSSYFSFQERILKRRGRRHWLTSCSPTTWMPWSRTTWRLRR